MKKILNFGSINIDYVYGVPHFVMPGETLSSLSLTQFPGGKGLNQSIALAQAGSNVYHAGKIAQSGENYLRLMADKGVNTEFIDTSGKEMGHTIIQVDASGQNCIILHHGANFEITTELIDKVLMSFAEGDLLILQNEINNMEYIINEAHKIGMEIAFNPSPIDETINKLPLNKITWFLLNEVEGSQITGKTNTQEILDSLIETFPQSRIVFTIGQDGAIYKDKTKQISHGIYNVTVADTTAAGDTFTGFFISEILRGSSEEIALEKASKASAIAVSRQGASVSIPSLKEVESSNLTLK